MGESYNGIRALADFIRDVAKYQQRALKISYKHLLKVRLVLNPVGWEMLEPRSRRIGQEQW